MKKFLTFLLLSTSLEAAIINSDDRHEIIDAPIKIQEISKSIAALVPKSNISKLPNGNYQLKGRNYVSDLKFCEDERFVADQKLIANCSASLVGPDLIATAGHCISDRLYSIDDYYVVFDYVENDRSDKFILSKDSVYEIESMPQHIFEVPGDKDVALLKLKRKVENRNPLKISKARPKLNQEIYMLGFPLGLAMKYHDNAWVTNTSTSFNAKDSFTSNLDSFSVNSGSAIFSRESNEIIGILVRGSGPNSQIDQERQCFVWGHGDHYAAEGNYIDLLKI